MIQFGGDINVSRIAHMGGSSGYINHQIGCNVPSPNFVASSPDESLDDKYVENLDPRLEIVEQPVSKFRFRYITEMKGPHGCLAGKSAKSTHTRTYPTVRLCNYYRDDAIVRCSLYTTDRNNPTPHAHALIGTSTDDRNKDESHEKSVHAQNDYTAEFPGLGILHVPQKKLVPKLYEKLVAAFEEKFRRGPGLNLSRENLAKSIEKIKEDVKQYAQEQAKCMDKNQVALLFEAFHMDERGIMQPICKPVLSDPIQNQKSPKTNDLKICRMDKVEGLCTGGEEIYILVEKVSKSNIQVHFVDPDAAWMAQAEFTPGDVHHQYAIVCRIPPYKNVDIHSDVKVQIKLYRPSDRAESKSLPFTYKPKFPIGKRARSDNWAPMKETYFKKQRTSFEHHFSENDVLTTSYMNLIQGDFSSEDYHDFGRTYASSCGRSISSSSDNCEDTSTLTDNTDDSLQSLLENFQPDSVLFSSFTDLTSINLGMPLTSENIVTDGTKPERRSKGSKPDSSERRITAKKSIGGNADSKTPERKPSSDETTVEDVTQRMADILIQDDEKVSQRCFGDTEHKAEFFKCVMEAKADLLEEVKEKVLLRLAASNSSEGLRKLLATGVRNINVRDENGATALHWAVRCRSVDCIELLLKCSDIELDITDSDGRTPLHIAVYQHDFEATYALVKAGADVAIPSGKTGDTVLHTAVKWKLFTIITLLLDTGKFTLEEENFNQKSVKTMVELSKDQELRSLFNVPANTCAPNSETSSSSPCSAAESSDEASTLNSETLS